MATGDEAQTIIYALIDPRTHEARYIGKTRMAPRARLSRHLREKSGAYRYKWIAELRELGLKPTIRLIETCGPDWAERERFWIAQHLSIGCALTNIAKGGEGCPGFRHTEEARRKIGEAAKGNKHASSLKGAKLRPETIEKMRRAQKGKVISADQRAKISISLRGKHPTEATRAKLRKRGFSDAHRKKLSDAARRQWADGRGWAPK